MKHLMMRLLIALLTLFLGVTAATLWAASPSIRKYHQVVNLNAPGLDTGINIRESDYLKAIEIINHNREYPITARMIEDLSTNPVGVDLDLGESIEDQIIFLHTHPGESVEFRVEQQFETSVTIMDEGPHVDLVDWKHYTSAWEELKMIGRNEFLTSKISGSESSKFPHVTGKEISAAIKEDEKWSQLARTCKSAQDYPCAVSVNKIRFRIAVRDGDQWKIIKQVEFNVPMGC